MASACMCKAMPGNAGGAFSQKFVAPRRAIPANDMQLGVWPAYDRSEIGKNLEQLGIVVMHHSGPMIAQKAVSFG